ncbi:MAG: hypothetical protein SPH85_11510, partial [Bacteroidales bacterium]|nr:hypothetical protein [Bacteroidales bacterium]
YIGPMHDIENCCSFLYICLWLFKYTKTSAVFFYFILTLSLEMSDDPYVLTLRRMVVSETQDNDLPAKGEMTICYYDKRKISVKESV